MAKYCSKCETTKWSRDRLRNPWLKDATSSQRDFIFSCFLTEIALCQIPVGRLPFSQMSESGFLGWRLVWPSSLACDKAHRTSELGGRKDRTELWAIRLHSVSVGLRALLSSGYHRRHHSRYSGHVGMFSLTQIIRGSKRHKSVQASSRKPSYLAELLRYLVTL